MEPAAPQPPPAAPPGKPRGPKTRIERIRNLIAGTISLGVSLVVANEAYKSFEPPEDLARVHSTTHQFIMYDPDLGWKERPNTDVTWEIFGHDTHIHINDLGMRYHEVGPKNRFRVAVVGDSLVWGYGVQDPERYTDRIETALGIDVLNFGHTGYGPVQYLLTMDKVIAQKPDLVVLSFTLYNDFDDNVHNINAEFYRPYADVVDGKLAILGQPVPDYRKYTWLKLPTYTQYALGRMVFFMMHDYARPVFDWLYGVDNKPPAKEGNVNFEARMIYYRLDTLTAWRALQVNQMVLAAIHDKLVAANIPMVIFAARTNLDENANTMNILRQQAGVIGVPVVTMENFERGDKYTYPDQIHWRANGHQMAAEALSPVIKSYMKP